jgi:hypothetical protein
MESQRRAEENSMSYPWLAFGLSAAADWNLSCL